MELHATRDSSIQDEAPASILPPREAPEVSLEVEETEPDETEPDETEPVFADQAPRVDSDPPQVLDLDELEFHDEAQRADSDPPQVLDLDELALHDESQRPDSDLPRAVPPELASEIGFQPEPEAPTLAAPGVGPLPAEARPAAAPLIKLKPKAQTTYEPQEVEPGLRPRKLLAPREAVPLEEIDAELVPESVQAELAARREAQDLSVAERHARARDANKRAALMIGGVFALGALVSNPVAGPAAFLVCLIDVAIGAGAGWFLGTKRPNRLVGAGLIWGAAMVVAAAHVTLGLALYGPGVLLGLFLSLVFFQAVAAFSGMYLAMHLEHLEFDQSI